MTAESAEARPIHWLSASRLSTLEYLTLVYLSIPWFLFLMFWLRPELSMIGTMILAIPLVHESLYRLRPAGKRITVPAVFIFSIAAIWMYFSGVGGYGTQSADWYGHILKFNILNNYDWPVHLWELSDNKQPPTLVYPLGFYLPGSFFSKAFGWEVGNWVLIFYVLAGLTMVLSWIRRLLGSKYIPAILLFPFLGGLDWPGWWIVQGDPHWPEHIEWWAYFPYLQLTANSTLLVYVPQHAIPGWLGAAWILYRADRQQSFALIGLLGTLVLLWSPFAAFGLLLLSLIALTRTRTTGLFHYSNTLIAPPLALVVLIYFGANEFNSPVEAFTVLSHSDGVIKLLLFVILEIGIYAWLCRPVTGDEVPADRIWWFLSITFILVLTLFRYGDFNDLLMRGAIPLQFVFWLFVLHYLLEFRAHKVRSGLLLALLAVGSISNLIELNRFNQHYVHTLWTKPHNLTISIIDPQFHGRNDSFFFRNLSVPRKTHW